MRSKCYPIGTLAFTPFTRFTFTVSVSLGLAMGLVSCVDGSLDSPGESSGSFGAGAAPGVGGTTGSNGVGATTGVGTGGSDLTGAGGTSATGSGGSSAPGSGGTPGSVGGSGNSTGGVGAGSGGTGGTGSQPEEPCTDIPAPSGNPDWEGTCQQWATETDECNADWFIKGGYCKQSCGRCKPPSNGGGSGGTGNSGGGGSGNPGNPGPSLPDITSGEVYFATRYWDCCKTHCATNAGAKSCGRDGVSHDGGGSACVGGSAYACYSEAPRAIGTNVSYGYVAVPNPQCHKCYHIQFTGQGQYNPNDPGSQRIAGKHMIVKVSNTGHDVQSKQFDLMIPGGGVGVNPGACRQQWGDIDFGATYGGFLSYDDKICYEGNIDQRRACVRQKCMQLPEGGARDGCIWWVDWLQLADNPQFRFREIDCPADI